MNELKEELEEYNKGRTGRKGPLLRGISIGPSSVRLCVTAPSLGVPKITTVSDDLLRETMTKPTSRFLSPRSPLGQVYDDEGHPNVW